MPWTILRGGSLLVSNMGQCVAEMALNHFRSLNSFNEAGGCSKGRVNVNVADVVDVATDQFHQTVDELWCDLRSWLGYGRIQYRAKIQTSDTP